MKTLVRVSLVGIVSGLVILSGLSARRREIALTQDALISQAPGRGLTSVHRFKHMPYVALEVDESALSYVITSLGSQHRTGHSNAACSCMHHSADRRRRDQTVGFSGLGQTAAIPGHGF
jgi:hypothetical protein